MTQALNPRALEATGGGALRWGIAAAVVATAYAGAVWLALALPPPEGVEGQINEAVMIELEPLVAEVEAPPPAPEPVPEPVQEAPAPPAEPTPPEPLPPEPVPPEPVVEQPPPEVVPPPEPEPEPPVEPEPEVAEPPPPEPPPPVVEPPVVEPPPEPEPPPPEPIPEPLPAPEEIVPELPAVETQSDAILNAPIPMARPSPPRPRPPVVKKQEAKKQEKPRPKKVAAAPPKRIAPKVASTRLPSQTRAASNSAAAPRVSSASWQRQAVSHFRKFRRQVAVRVRGTARVAVTIDRRGRVLSARLAGSSGNGDFDQEALALVRRASPIPAPPEGVGGNTLSLTVPVNM